MEKSRKIWLPILVGKAVPSDPPIASHAYRPWGTVKVSEGVADALRLEPLVRGKPYHPPRRIFATLALKSEVVAPDDANDNLCHVIENPHGVRLIMGLDDPNEARQPTWPGWKVIRGVIQKIYRERYKRRALGGAIVSEVVVAATTVCCEGTLHDFRGAFLLGGGSALVAAAGSLYYAKRRFGDTPKQTAAVVNDLYNVLNGVG